MAAGIAADMEGRAKLNGLLDAHVRFIEQLHLESVCVGVIDVGGHSFRP